MDVPEDLVQSAFSHLLGCRLQRLDQGVAEVALALAPHLRNRGGKLHGGAIFSLVDIAMGLACSSAHGFDQQSVTVECKINYLRPVSDGEVLCVARVLQAGRRILVVDADVLQGDKLMARAQGTFATL
ncbi:PaaI family thioesterase [Pseudomonas sp. MAFF212428]|uniref:PaaI family thioesterase n=1 Tax=Pseudomonas brassicae TaxID=2708063 RepID=A0A6B3NNI9_9PSED|nr:PaaI family thioesterase [Pseudomonas brassicae]NER59612.1 PaaI family thioesterase [Pseudomonas brassicae]NER62601.1 PaaI family thioesterase [Pseudomonas brassicae]